MLNLSFVGSSRVYYILTIPYGEKKDVREKDVQPQTHTFTEAHKNMPTWTDTHIQTHPHGHTSK